MNLSGMWGMPHDRACETLRRKMCIRDSIEADDVGGGSMKGLYDVARHLVWLTQFGLSIVIPPVLRCV